MNNHTQDAYNKINHSIYYYIPFILIFLKHSFKSINIIESCFYFTFIFDENYRGLLKDIKTNSNFIKKLRNYHYYKMRNKEKYLGLYYMHFLKLVSVCVQNNLLNIEANTLVLTEKGILMAKDYDRKIDKFPSTSTNVIFRNNIKTLAAITSNFELIDILEKIGVKSL